MNYFRYKLIAPSGEVSSGTTKLPYKDLMSDISHLERDGSLTLYVKKLGSLRSFLTGLGRGFRGLTLDNASVVLDGFPVTGRGKILVFQLIYPGR